MGLGAYMGGVFHELVKEAVKPEPKININIITGASAGAMSGVIATYYLLGEGRERLLSGDIEKDFFYQAWVEKADVEFIEKLQPEEINRTNNLSILSGEAIRLIAKLVEKPPQITAETKPLALLMTLTNLQGLLKEESGTKVITSAETRKFLFKPGLEQTTVESMWKKVVIGGLASGAFPVAFPPIAVLSEL